VVRPLMWISTNVLWKVADVAVIDGAVNADRRRDHSLSSLVNVARESERFGSQLRNLEFGPSPAAR